MLSLVPAEPIDVGAALAARVASFVRLLRDNGFGVGADDPLRALQVAGDAGVLDRDVLRWNLKALLCGRSEEWRRFDGLFEAWFARPNRSVFASPRSALPGCNPGDTGGHAADECDPPAHPAVDGRDPSPPDAADDPPCSPACKPGNPVAEGTPSNATRDPAASPRESLARTDFSALRDGTDAATLQALMRTFARQLKHLQLRRDRPFAAGRRLDLRRTLRASVATGGTPLALAWRARRRVRPRLVLLVDVSRSMNAYSFFWLRLARALCAELADVQAFVFHTRLTAIGEALRDPDPYRAQERLHLLAEGWGGGTRIGECLGQFVRDHAPRLVHGRTGVIVVSDGYDTGPPDALAAALAALRRRARRLVWLNPLAGHADWRPESGAMRAAIPHVDLLAPGASLADVARVLPDIVETLA